MNIVKITAKFRYHPAMAGVDSPGLQEAEEGEEACLVRGEGADTGDSPACSWTGRPGCLAEETEMRVPGTATARRRGQNHHRPYISSSLSL